MKKKLIALFIFLIPSAIIANSACEALTQQLCERDMNNWARQGQPYICTAMATPPTFTIDMTNYAAVIVSAIAGTALNGESTPLSFPACVAETADPSWNDVFATYFQVNTSWNVTTALTNADFPHAGVNSLMQISNATGQYLGAKVAWCPCGSYVNGGGCTTTAFYPYLNSTYLMAYNDNGAGTFNLGHCVDGETGGLLLWIYTPNLQIPPMGTYSTELQIQAQSVVVRPPQDTRAKFIKP